MAIATEARRRWRGSCRGLQGGRVGDRTRQERLAEDHPVDAGVAEPLDAGGVADPARDEDLEAVPVGRRGESADVGATPVGEHERARPRTPR